MPTDQKSYNIRGFRVTVRLMDAVVADISESGELRNRYLVRVVKGDAKLTAEFFGCIAAYYSGRKEYREAAARILDDLASAQADPDEFVAVAFVGTNGEPMGWTAQAVRIAGKMIRYAKRKGIDPTEVFRGDRLAWRLAAVDRLLRATDKFDADELAATSEYLREKGLV